MTRFFFWMNYDNKEMQLSLLKRSVVTEKKRIRKSRNWKLTMIQRRLCWKFSKTFESILSYKTGARKSMIHLRDSRQVLIGLASQHLDLTVTTRTRSVDLSAAAWAVRFTILRGHNLWWKLRTKVKTFFIFYFQSRKSSNLSIWVNYTHCVG